MKIKDLRNLDKNDLQLKLKAAKDELYKLNFQRKAGRVEKPHMFKLIKKDIARINTILSQMEKQDDKAKA
ncbi:MAG: 50S ribosomal protein L29 [Candidatus Omnitrophota bacterium]